MWDRMIFALTVSLAVHFVVVLVIQGKPTQADGATSVPLIARLDSVQGIRPDPAIAEPAEQPTPLPADDLTQQCALAYLSDYFLTSTVVLTHTVSMMSGQVMMASLDHAMWFHRPCRADDWMLISSSAGESTS